MIFGLEDSAIALIRGVLRQYPAVREVRIFGSRAMGTHQSSSDIDLAVWGELDAAALAELSAELDELPLPYQFDVKAYDTISHKPVRDHIDRHGKPFYLRQP